MTTWARLIGALQAGAAKEYEKLSSSLEVKEHELKLLEERAGQSLHAMQAGQVRAYTPRLLPHHCHDALNKHRSPPHSSPPVP